MPDVNGKLNDDEKSDLRQKINELWRGNAKSCPICGSNQWVIADRVTDRGITISMDGKGSWRDNVFVERLWRSIKYEEVYLRAYESVGEARTSIGRYLDFYNGKRPHQSLDGATPDQAYFTKLPLRVAA
jgi:transposase InsO family protein